MATTDLIFAKAKQGEPGTFVGRIRNVQGALITQASLSTITYAIYDLKALAPPTLILSGSVPIASSVFDALQQNAAIWPVDSTGYNFSFTLPQTSFPNAGPAQRYAAEFKFTDVAGLKWTAGCKVTDVITVLSAPL